MPHSQYNTVCSKCGRLIPRTTHKNKNCLCSVCQSDKQDRARIIPLGIVGALIALILIAGFGWLAVTYHNATTYEEYVASVFDKDIEAGVVSAGRTSVAYERYYLILDDMTKVQVSAFVYDKTDIGDYITVRRKLVNGSIVSVSYR